MASHFLHSALYSAPGGGPSGLRRISDATDAPLLLPGPAFVRRGDRLNRAAAAAPDGGDGARWAASSSASDRPHWGTRQAPPALPRWKESSRPALRELRTPSALAATLIPDTTELSSSLADLSGSLPRRHISFSEQWSCLEKKLGHLKILYKIVQNLLQNFANV